MSRRAKREEEKVKSKIFSKIIVVAIFLGLVFFVLKVAPNYVNTEIADKTNLVINNSNVTEDLKQELIIRDGIIYISKEDIENFFDPYIYYEQGTNQILLPTMAREWKCLEVFFKRMTHITFLSQI